MSQSTRLIDIRQLKIDIEQLSVAERILLVQNIWDGIAAEQETLPLTDAQKKELDRRLEEHRNAPDEGATWEEVKERIRRNRDQ